VHAEGLADDGIEQRKGFKFLIGWQVKGAVSVREVFDLLLIEFLAGPALSKVGNR